MKDHERFVATKSIPVLFNSRLGCKPNFETWIFSKMIAQMLTDALIRGWQTTCGVNVSTWLQIKKMKAPLIIADLDVPYTSKISKARIAVSSWFSFLGLRADVVVIYPTPNVHFQATGSDISIEQAILFERRATRVSQDRARKWHARATPAGHLPSLSAGAHSYVSSAKACLCPRGKKGGRETMGRTFTTLLPFFFFLIIVIITGIPSESLCGGERRGAPERETRNDWGAVAPV